MDLSSPTGPRRIVCLTEEPTEILYALGEEDRIVGISAYTVRPPEAKRDKPVVSAFVGGSVEKIVALRPDLVIGFSDIQAQLAKDLIAAGLAVLIFNQRSVREILEVILSVGRIVGAEDRARSLVEGLRLRLEETLAVSSRLPHRPRVYFEEWDDPQICGIRWVSQLVELAGGHDVFAERSLSGLARDRIVSPADVVRADPEVILASWCGKSFDRNALEGRPGFSSVDAVRTGRVHEIDAAIILQPGPAALTDGLDALVRLIRGPAKAGTPIRE
jgi:iron complex transport system substrate-binding protein